MSCAIVRGGLEIATVAFSFALVENGGLICECYQGD
jgi:hypothetical protein